jgi:hypothetical protein
MKTAPELTQAQTDWLALPLWHCRQSTRWPGDRWTHSFVVLHAEDFDHAAERLDDLLGPPERGCTRSVEIRRVNR